MDNLQYPLVSLCILSYNQEKFIREAINGALSQDYPNLELIISDDMSTDATFDIIQGVTKQYKGLHKLIINQNQPNLGLARHANKVMYELSHGEYIILSGGDDVCLPHLISNAIEQMRNTDCSSMAFNTYKIDGESKPIGIFEEDINHSNEVFTLDDFVSYRHKTSGACRIIKRDILNTFGPLNNDCQTEDTPNLFRSFLYGKVGYCYIPNLKYRIHDNNISCFRSLMTRFDPKKICAQYQRDLNTAKQKGLIADEESIKAQRYLDEYLRKQVAIRKIYNQDIYIMQLICAVLYAFNPKFTIDEVVEYISLVRMWKNNNM